MRGSRMAFAETFIHYSFRFGCGGAPSYVKLKMKVT